MDNSSNTFQFRLPRDQLDKFKLACKENGVKPSQMLRSLMQKYADGTAQQRKSKELDKEYTIGEMYCGPGGIGWAAKHAEVNKKNKKIGFVHKWATDNHQDTCDTYENNIVKNDPGASVICKDVRNLDIDALPNVDGFLYGFPCNDFSNVGESRGLQGAYGPLYSFGVEYIRKANPKFLFAENVSGLSNANSGYAFGKILRELESAGNCGYDLTCHLYKFEDYGIPQARHRYIIVGFRKDLNLKFGVPKPSGIKRTSKDALSNPPIPEDAKNQELTRQSKNVIERLKNTNAGENAWTANLPDHLKLNVKGAKLSMIYKRLHPDQPAYTVTGSGGGGTHMYHWKEPRALTNRERARLQTFPDDFVFYGSKESVRRQIGMAVPVEGAKIILESILKTFEGIDYETVKPNVDIAELKKERSKNT